MAHVRQGDSLGLKKFHITLSETKDCSDDGCDTSPLWEPILVSRKSNGQ